MQPSQLPIIRNDLQAYLEERKGAPELKPPPVFPKTWYQGNVETYAEPTCSLYMAESSIPNAGLGIFAGRAFFEEEPVDPSPQVVIPLIDLENSPLYTGSVLANYPWAGWSQGAHFEAVASTVLYPNLGMLANSHLGLANVDQNAVDGQIHLLGSTDRESDFSAGANTLYHGATFNVSKKPIRAGEEIFVDYGVSYFHFREEQFNMVFPTSTDYAEADEIVEDFAKKIGDEITDKNRREWKKIIMELEEDMGNEDDEDDKGKFRVAFALPENVEDVKYVATVGTARYSIPESIRSLEWLEENGVCLDNMRMGKSNIPYAGYGKYIYLHLNSLSRHQGVSEINTSLFSESAQLIAIFLFRRCICHTKPLRGINSRPYASCSTIYICSRIG